MLDAPFIHGFFSLDFFCICCLLLLPRGHIVYGSICYAILFLIAFFYEPTMGETISFLKVPQWSDFFVAVVYLIVVLLCLIVPRKKLVVITVMTILYVLILIGDATNILSSCFHMSLLELWKLAECFWWGIPIFFIVPIFQTGLVIMFAYKITEKQTDFISHYPIFPLVVFVAMLLLNWGINAVQMREHILSTPLIDFASRFDNDNNRVSMNSMLLTDMKEAFPIYELNDLNNVDSSYNHIVMVLVESWGVPKNVELLKAQLRPFDGLQTAFVGLYPRTVAYTQGAEWEDFGIPGGTVNDSLILPLRYRKAGYETWYVHGYDGDFYEREKTYPSYGFDSLLFRKDFFAMGLKGCQYGFPGVCDKSLGTWLSDKLNNDKKQFFYWTTLDAHYPYEGRNYASQSQLCKEFNLSSVACTFYSHEEETLQTVAQIAKKYPNIKFIIRGDHRPMGTFTTADFLASFYYDWVPLVVIN